MADTAHVSDPTVPPAHQPVAAHRPARPIDRFDPGWLFLISGIALLAAAVIIPAQADLIYARWQEQRALAIEAQRQERLFKHERFLQAILSREPALVRALAASQLNLVPAARQTHFLTSNPTGADASIFPSLEPAPIHEPELHQVDSLLARWSQGQRSQLWLVAVGSLLVFVGIMPWNTPRQP